MGGVSRHAGNAACALSTAAFTSAAPPAGHSEITSPVDGLNTGVDAIFGWIHLPSKNIGHGVRAVIVADIGFP